MSISLNYAINLMPLTLKKIFLNLIIQEYLWIMNVKTVWKGTN